MRDYRINIVGLSNKVHTFQFEVENAFFEHYGKGLVSEGSFSVKVELDKHETFLDARFEIQGQARLVCDRSLDPFMHPVRVDKRIMFKYGEVEQEMSDEIVVISRDADSLELGQYIYEFIGLEIPMKKLHPRYAGEPDDGADGRIIYSSEKDGPENGGDVIDPRWDKLKKLK